MDFELAQVENTTDCDDTWLNDASSSKDDDITNIENVEDKYLNIDIPLQEQLDYLEFDTKYEIKTDQLMIGALLGSGFFSEVHMGTLSSSIGKVIVAVKMPKVNDKSSNLITSENRDQRKVLRSELKILTYLQSASGGHENVLRLVGAITTTRADFCVLTEYCEWGSLDQFLKKKFNDGDFENEIVYEESKGQTTSKQIWKTEHDSRWAENFESRRERGLITTSDLMWFALQIARAMQFLTEKRVLHRDVALRNVLLKSDFTLKVADFGLSKKLNDGDEAYQIWKSGSALPIRYLAPESLTAGRFTMHSECWSFGVVVWEIFTFAINQPYSTELERSSIKDQLVSGLMEYLAFGHRLTIPNIVPMKVKSLLNDLWNEDPEQRPTFRTCKKIIRHELLQSCEKIFICQKTSPLHASELSLIVMADTNPKRIKWLQDKWRRSRRLVYLCILVSLLVVCASLIGTLIPLLTRNQGVSECTGDRLISLTKEQLIEYLRKFDGDIAAAGKLVNFGKATIVPSVGASTFTIMCQCAGEGDACYLSLFNNYNYSMTLVRTLGNGTCLCLKFQVEPKQRDGTYNLITSDTISCYNNGNNILSFVQSGISKTSVLDKYACYSYKFNGRKTPQT